MVQGTKPSAPDNCNGAPTHTNPAALVAFANHYLGREHCPDARTHYDALHTHPNYPCKAWPEPDDAGGQLPTWPSPSPDSNPKPQLA